MKLSTRIWLLVVILLLFQLTIFFISNNSIQTIKNNEKLLSQKYVGNMKKIGFYSTDFMEARKLVAEYLAFKDASLKQQAQNKLKNLLEDIDNLNLDSNLLQLKEEALTDINNYLTLLTQYNSTEELTKNISNFSQVGDTAIKAFNLLQSKIDDAVEDITTQNLKKTDHIIRVGITIIIVAMLLGILLSVIIIRIIRKKLKVLMNYARSLSNKDYTVEIPDIKDNSELGRLIENFKIMHLQLTKDMRDISKESITLIDSMKEINYTLDSSSQGIQDTTSAITSIAEEMENITAVVEETTASIEEISSATRLIAESATDAAQFGHDSTEQAEEAGNTVKKAINKMSEITETTQEIDKVVKEFNVSAEKINNFVNTISDIAEQTNLLSLNAAIEAARAGEAGKGFAVVADEIRVLAEGSREAADEIKTVVEGVMSVSNEALNVSTLVNKKVKEGSDLSNEAGKHLDEILLAMKEVTDKLESIAAGVEEQSASVDEISTAITELSSNTVNVNEAIQEINASMENQTANIETITSETQQTTELASRLEEIVKQFKL